MGLSRITFILHSTAAGSSAGLLRDFETIQVKSTQVKMSGSESDCASNQSMEQELFDQVPEGEQSEAHADPAPALDKEPSGGSGGAAKGKAKKQRLTEIQKLDVCDFLRERPYIYNKSHCDFKNKSLKDCEWSLLAQRLKVDVNCITTWYQSMRTILARTKKQKAKSGSGTGKLTHVQQWVCARDPFIPV